MSGFLERFGDVVGGAERVRQLFELRTQAVSRFGLFAPDAMYPVYECPSCREPSISLSVLAPELECYDSFVQFVRHVTDLAGALPLASCPGCGGAGAAEPTWVGLFTYLASIREDLFLRIEATGVADAWRLPAVGDAVRVGPLAEDEAFLAAFGFPFSHRWGWRTLLRGQEAAPALLRVRKLEEGWFLAAGPGHATAEGSWQGWFATHRGEAELDSAVLLDRADAEGYEALGPRTWLGEHAAPLAAGALVMTVLYSLERFRRMLEGALMQRGIRLEGDGDPFSVHLEEYWCEVNLAALLRMAAYAGLPPDRVLRRHLLGRLEYLEGIRGAGSRLRELLAEHYRTEVRDGCVLDVREQDSDALVRSVELGELSEQSMAPRPQFEAAVREHLGLDPSTGRFTSGT